MSNWFAETFNEYYLTLYAHRSEEEAELFVRWLVCKLELPPRSRVLDAPCGGGRHSHAFARYGMRVVGLDLSHALLAAAKVTPQPSEQVAWVRGDLRTLPLSSESFDVVANIFSSFGYFADERENLEVLQELVRVLRAGGHFVLDFMNASYVRKNLVPFSERSTPQGWRVCEFRQIAGNPPRVEKTAILYLPDGTEREFRESVRLYEPHELEAAVKTFGLGNLHIYGDYDGAPWHDGSPRAIIIARKKGQ
ncbi:MAG: class I SAM-dependent methyltransferase [Candidatus Sumerlaeaceae bacterium]|jgi:SAM-dependent methyltransferase